MSPKRVVFGLWLAAAALAAGYFLSTSDSDYREFAPAAVNLPSVRSGAPVNVAVSQPVSASTSTPVTAPASPADVVGSAVAVATVGPVTAPMAKVTPDAAAPKSPVADVTPSFTVPRYRPAFLASAAEREESAKLANVSRADFLRACDHDHDLNLAAGAAPAYFCRALKAPVGPQYTTAITTTTSYPESQTFLLHSRPSASRKIYLDFNGHTTINTPWNNTWNRPNGFTTPPYTIDGDTSTFNSAEHAVIQTVWRRMAEDFAPFDVDVTTEDPGSAGLLKTASNDLSHGMRVVFGPDQNNTGAGGVAYVGSFDTQRTANSSDIPCFVFADVGADAKFMSEAASHEVGHTVGLTHDGATGGTEYFTGHGTGANSWAPIMGVGYYKDVVQWSKGEYTNANNTQDDLQVISGYLPFITDDHGDTPATSTFASGTSYSGAGIVSTSADVDLFQIVAGRGDLVITPKVALSSPNLRLQVRVLNAAGTVLGTYVGDGTAGNLAPGPITITLTQDGAHFIEFSGIANGDGVSAGYSDYGSLGFYTFDATWGAPGNKTPVANASRTAPLTYNYQTQPNQLVTFDGTLSSDPDGTITRYSWDFNDVYPRTAEGAIQTHRYRAPGVYRPVLTVTDDSGATASTVVTINVTGPVRSARCSLALISGTFIRLNSVSDAANVTIEVKDQYGNPLRGALVDVAVSGLARSQRTTLRTDIMGRINMNSPAFRRGATGSLRFDVTRVASATHPYVAADNACPTFVILSR
jgi:hypothetical protein